jgi:NAD-dependent dihydropyrimidine dehydrogenase PreA subunit
MAYTMGLDPGRLRFLQKANQAGLGDYDLEKIECIGELKRIPDYHIPPLGGDANMNNETQELICSKTTLLPQVDIELCTACASCIEQCPMGALHMGENDIPEVNAEECITCFCCQEMCPEKAITLC